MWKFPVSASELSKFKSVSVCIKVRGKEPERILSTTVGPEHAGGTLIVFLQARENHSYQAGLLMQGPDGSDHSSWAIIDDPFATGAGTKTTSASSLRPGIVMLKSAGDFLGADPESEPESAAIYLKLE